MAETILAVVEKLTLLLSEEVDLLKGVKDKVETLMMQLNLMEGVVKDADADARQAGSEAYNRWLSQIRDLGYQAVDVIETYRNDSESKSFLNLKFMRLHNVNGEIDKIQSNLKALHEARDSFGITSHRNTMADQAIKSQEEQLRTWREPPAILKVDDYIDLVDDTNKMAAQLNSMDHVVAIFGMGGLGKTTLAYKLYNHNKLEFECKAFVSVSKQYNTKDILYQILDGVCAKKIVRSEIEAEKDLIIKLHNFLQGKRYLVVLDDLWEKEDWNKLKGAFPGNTMGSKVMITTQNVELPTHAGSTNPLEPRLLKDGESLELLRKKTFPNNPEFPPEFVNLGTVMVKKCHGLPLAVVVLGGLLSGQRIEQWEILSRNSKWSIMNDPNHQIPTVLALSYNYLPFHLKLCFQHLGIFPEDYNISKNELIRLWVAERFLPRQGDDTEEDVAEKCLYELINRSIVQAGTRTSRGRVKAIRIHDILRDYSIMKAMEGNFLQIYSGKEVGPTTSGLIKSRRLAIHGTYKDYAFLEQHTPHLRSLHFFGKVVQKIDFVYKKSKLLNVLEVSGTEYQGKQDYKVLENLTQLRYLRFRGRTQVNMTSSIGKLLNLQTLDLRHCVTACAIPDVIWKIKRLRHLLFNSKSSHMQELRLDTLILLQTLQGVYSGRWAQHGLLKMIHMRRLELIRVSTIEAEWILNSVTQLRHLQSLSLKMHWCQGTTIPPFEKLFGCVHLQKLYLDGIIEKLPGADEFPPNLAKLVLVKSELQQDSIATLEKLPRLKMLSLNRESYTSNELVCSSEGFPQLEVLHLNSLSCLTSWTAEEGALRNLKNLLVRDCYGLEQIPDQFKSLVHN